MPSSNQDISNDNITRDINKALLLANKNKKKIIVEILNKLNIKSFLNIRYRGIDFTSEDLFKSILFMDLKGLNQQNLEIYLKTHKNERKKLGLKRTPDQTTISHFLVKLDEQSKNIINLTVNKIEEIAGKQGILLDAIKIKVSGKKRSRKTGTHYLKNMTTREISKQFKKNIQPFIDFKLKKNCVYNEKILFSLALYIAKEKKCAELGAELFQEELKKIRVACPKCKGSLYPKEDITKKEEDKNIFICSKCGKEKRISPLGATFRYQLKKNHTPSEILNMFTRVSEKLWRMTPESKASKKPGVIVAIDNTEWLFYGKKDNSFIVGKKFENGAKYCYKFMVISIVEAGKRYVLMALPYTQFDNQRELLNKLIEFARQRVTIRLALLDRGFFNTESQKLLQSYRIKYIIPAIENKDIKNILKNNPTPFVLNGCVMRKELIYNLAAIKRISKKGEEVHGFATNIHLKDTDMEKEANWIAEEYRKRWGIETIFRVIKDFLPKTTSKDYRIRLFYFLFSVLIYNMWILADILVCLELFGKVLTAHIVKAKFFSIIFFYIDPGG